MQRILDNNAAIAQLVRGEWVQIALFNPDTSQIHRYVRGEFVLYVPESRELPLANSSLEWYRGYRDHLGYASIVPDSGPTRDQSDEETE
jgi:uncharacterized protein